MKIIILNIVLLTLYLINISYSKNINITSDELIIDRENNVSTFTGNVYVIEEGMEIWADQLTVKLNYDENKVKEIYAKHNVKIVRENIVATGERGLYYPIINEIRMYEGVEVAENNNLVKCDELFLDIENAISIMKSKSENRVEAIIVDKE